jgi:hypothetical protein
MTAGTADPPPAYQGEILVRPGNEDVAADPFEGAGVFSSWKDVVTAGDAGEFAAAGVAAGLDSLGAVMDPLGSLASAGIGWLIEHVWWLHEPLDRLAGDPIQIRAHAQTWANVSEALVALAGDYRADVDGLTGWDGAAALAYRQAATDFVGGLTQGARSAFDISRQVLGAGATIGAVRALIRDAIAHLVLELITWGLSALATAVVSAGSSLAAFVGWAVTRAVLVASRIANRVAALLDELASAAARLSRTVDDLDDVARALGRGADDLRSAGRAWSDAAGPAGREAAELLGKLPDRPAPGARAEPPGGVFEAVEQAAAAVPVTETTELWKQHEQAGTTPRDWEQKVREERP